ncbi:hypothetical protein OIU78_018916 [Salix suchowensis]|nr:hypothetical protein OIU78_018916 [Salix suchowensis]
MGIVIERVRFLEGIIGEVDDGDGDNDGIDETFGEIFGGDIGEVKEGNGDNLVFGDGDGDNDGIGETFGGDFRGKSVMGMEITMELVKLLVRILEAYKMVTGIN